MHRLAALLRSVLLAGAIVGAPAPIGGPWASGWDKPAGPAGKFWFHRKGDKLTITVRGTGRCKGEARAPGQERESAPRLLRDVEGDFVVQVRVAGEFRPGAGPRGFCSAGILLVDATTDWEVKLQAVVFAGNTIAVVGEQLDQGSSTVTHVLNDPTGIGEVEDDKGPLGRPPYLRVERRSDSVQMAFSHDNKRWKRVLLERKIKLGRKLKVGVRAEVAPEGTFEPIFDQFKLTRLK